mgnify:CR=1 FL=1
MNKVLLLVVLLFSSNIIIFCQSQMPSNSDSISDYDNLHEATKRKDSSLNYFQFLESIGIVPSLTYKGELWSVNKDSNKKNHYLDNFDLLLDVDLSKILKIDGANLKFHILGNNGSDPSSGSGVRQGLSNIAAPNAWKLFQLYYEQNLFSDKLSLLIGLFDLNAHYDVKEVQSMFLNPSHGIGADFAQSGKNGPSIFPTSSFGIKLNLNFLPDNYLSISILDGVPGDPDNPYKTVIRFDKEDGYLVCAELGYNSSKQEQTNDIPKFMNINNNYSRLGLGTWYYTPRLTLLENFTNWGYYLFLEQKIFSETDSEQGIYISGRFGIADDEVNQFDSFINGSISYKGLFPTRDNDKLGFAFAWGHNSNLFRRNQNLEGYEVEKFEKAYELTYQLNFDNIIFQPGIQFIVSPSNPESYNYDNVFAFYTRLIINL